MFRINVGKLRWWLARIGEPLVILLTGVGFTIDSVMWRVVYLALGGFYIVLVESAIRPEQYDSNILASFLLGFLNLIAVDQDNDVRCTIWMPTGTSRSKLRRATAYMPHFDSSSADELDVSKGIVGKSFRTGQPHFLILEEGTTDREYRQILVADWGFTMEEALRINTERRAFLAVPVVDEHLRVIAVIYVDSIEAGHIIDNTDPGGMEAVERAAALLEPLLSTMRGKFPT